MVVPEWVAGLGALVRVFVWVGLLLELLGDGGAGVFVAFFVKARGEFLDDLDFELGTEVGDAARGDEGVL